MKYLSPKRVLIQRLIVAAVLVVLGIVTVLWRDLGLVRWAGFGYVCVAGLLVYVAYKSWSLDPYG